jgi:hypothetical protein
VHHLETVHIYHLVAVGIAAGSPEIGTKAGAPPPIPDKKRRNRPPREVLLTQLQRLREQGHHVETIKYKVILVLLEPIWPKNLPLPLRDAVDRALGRRK